jgi:hypothetical protein
VPSSSITVPPESPPPADSYTVSGNRILNPQGRTFVPYGVTTFGLSGHYSDWKAQVPKDMARISAIAGFWHGNTVRMQIAPTWVTGNTPGYLTAVEGLVSAAENAGLNVIISAQYEYTTKQPMATTQTEAFWNVFAHKYAHDPRVWFDLFNEPQIGPKARGWTDARVWQFWRNGGTITKDGRTTAYVGMQQLIDDVRGIDKTNLLFAEGIQGAKSLKDVLHYRLDGPGIVYAIHSYLNPGFDTMSDWKSDWGQVAQSVPVVDDEFGEQEGTMSSCRPNAPALVPQLLSYLAARHIGLIAHALVPGSLTKGNSLTDPTSFSPSKPYRCGRTNKGINNQGAGQDILQYFTTQAAGPG